MTPRAVVSSVDEPPGRSDLGGRRTPRLQVRATKPPAEAGRGRRSESPQVKPTILTLPRPWTLLAYSSEAHVGRHRCGRLGMIGGRPVFPYSPAAGVMPMSVQPRPWPEPAAEVSAA